MKSQGHSIIPQLCNFYHRFIYGYSKSQSHSRVLPTRVPPGISPMSAILPLKHLKKLSPQLQSLPIGSQTLKSQSRLMPQLCTCHCPFNYNSRWWLAPYCIPLSDLYCPGTQLWCPWQRATCNFLKLSNDGDITSKALDFLLMWSPITGICNTFNDQNPHVSTSTLVWIPLQIQPHNPFLSWKTQNQPDALTRWWDIYLKEGNSDYASVNPQNYTRYSLPSNWHRPFELPPYHSQSSMDLSSLDAERLHSDIWAQLRDDPISTEHLDNQSDPKWTLNPDGLLRHFGCIYVPNSGNLWLRVLQYSHDHPLAGHFSQTKTLHQVHMLILLVRTSSLCQGLLKIMHHLFPCQTCMHKPYRLSSNFQFPRSLGIPSPWIS